MIIVYNIVLLLLFLPALLVLTVRYRKRLVSEGTSGIAEKLGFWRLSRTNIPSPLLWIHCASLGEVRAVEPLIRELDGYRILISTLTPTGYDYARKRNLTDLVYFAPLDFSFIVNRLFRRLKPAALIVVETELWPGLLHAAHAGGAKVIIVNGRLSARSYPYYRFMRPFWKRVLSEIDRVCARAPEDAGRFGSLGMAPERIIMTGNIKYDHDFNAAGGTRRDAGFDDADLLWVCGSTREGEERLLLDAYRELKQKHPALKIIIAPRHLDRVPALRRLLEQNGIRYRLRSQDAAGTSDALLLDTFGELQAFYRLSDITYVGGSLVNKGGQNPIEPAAAAKPVLFGPHMENFLSEAKLLQETGGGFTVQDTARLLQCLDRLCTDRSYRLTAGQQAQAAVEKQKGALARTARIIRDTVR